ncbi:MAG: FAD:protein FMN transferase [Cyclobacteriaceae bacterium]|nr:FAD:protein FMN transferase [Cyclobacteriaceae bacterium]
MNARAKNALYAFLLLLLIGAVYTYRKGRGPQPIRLEGETMATTYHITYFDGRGRNFKSSVDSLLVEVNKSINTYDSSSEVSRFNRAERSFVYERRHFYKPLRISQGVVAGSQGAYDPTVMPLVNAWGFGPKRVDQPDTAEILEIRSFVGFEKLNFNTDSVWKSDPRVQVDFGGIGQGYGADVITEFLRAKGIDNFFVELGGEGVASGKNLAENREWEIGILDPNSDYLEQRFMARARLNNQGFSTSGNYFNYRVVDGKKYSHTIDPISGFPVQRELLSATVLAADCSTADAWATAFMSMGHEKAIPLLAQHPELSVLFVFSTKDGMGTFVSESIRERVTLER